MHGTVYKETMGANDAPCREVTPEEIAHYHEFGWVMLKGFVRAERVKLILNIAYQRMGEDADSNAIIETIGPGVEKKIAYFNAEFGGGLANPPVRSLIGHVGKNGQLLMSH